jgi:hypothetical protein
MAVLELNHFSVRPAALAVCHWIVIQGFLNSTFCVHRLKFSPIQNIKIIKVYYSPTNAQVTVLKTILKFTIKYL